MYKMSLEHLILLENKRVIKKEERKEERRKERKRRKKKKRKLAVYVIRIQMDEFQCPTLKQFKQ